MIDTFNVLLVTCGWYRRPGDVSTIDTTSQTNLVNFLNRGKGLYIEGCDVAFYNNQTNLFRMFGCTFIGDGNPPGLGNVQTVFGQDSSIVRWKLFSYLYKQAPDRYVDIIGPAAGRIFFKSQDSLGRAVHYGGPTNSYRVIYSTFIFGALRDSINTKTGLMAIYMRYLLGGPSLIGESSCGSLQALSVSPNPAWRRTDIEFNLSREARVRMRLYNVAGQMVCRLIDGQLMAGIHRISWKGKDDLGRKVNCGSYVLRVEIDGNVTARVVVLMH